MKAVANRLYAAVCAQSVTPRSYILQLASALPGALRDHTALLALVFAYWICGLAIGEMSGRAPTATIMIYLPTYRSVLPMMVVALLVGRTIVIMAVERPARPLTQFLLEFRTSLGAPRRVAHAVPVLLSLLVFSGTFTVVKTSLPLLLPFTWDVPLERLDRWLHGGIAPWELLQPIFGSPIVTHALNWAYNFWFYILGFILMWQAFSQRNIRLRMQFFFSLVLGWVLLGTVAAALFSSAGPCYFGRVTGLSDPFAPLISYLREVDHTYPVWAIRAQDKLWQTYLLHDVSLGAGISAMPSMHVALATLFALVSWRTKLWLGIIMSIYATVILVGSVHLAWHYAIDGYFSIAGMILIWWIVGRALARPDEASRSAAITDMWLET